MSRENKNPFVYYRVSFILTSEMLGPCAPASIWDQHVIKKAQKEIKKANMLTGKLTKIAQQFVGPEISEIKEIAELQGIIKTFSELIGEPIKEMPKDIHELLNLAKEVEAKFQVIVKAGDEAPATVFMRMDNGKGGSRPIISSHTVLGNLKKNMSIMVNNGDKTILTTKTSVGEVFALDVKPIEPFMFPDRDIMIRDDGSRVLCERPVQSNDMGKIRTAIAQSEQLPIGTTFGCTLRVRVGSPITFDVLKYKLFPMGRSNGFGPWRSSGGKGQYRFKIEELPDFVEPTLEGWL